MGKQSQAPDPYATAAAQTQSNQQTANYNAALNRVSQYTPYGNSVYNQTGTDSSGAPTWSNTISLAPQAQTQLDNQLKQNDQLSNIGFGLADEAQASLANPVTGAGLPGLMGGGSTPSLATGFSSPGQLQTGVNLQSGFSAPGSLQTGVNLQTGFSTPGQVQSGLNTSGVSALPNSNNYADQMKQAQDASYSAATRYLNPQYTNAQNDLDSKLANQGVTQGSEAYNRAETELGNQRDQAYGAARDSAIQTGNALQAQLFGQGIQGNQAGMANAEAQGNFANSAQQQGFGQSQAQALFGNNAAEQQAAFGNAAQQQGFGQAQAQAAFGNTAAQQQAEFANSAQQQGFGQAQTTAAFGNSALAQQYQQYLAGAGASNAARAQGLQEQTQLSTMPLNQLNALRSGTQIQNPQFTAAPQSQAAGTDISGDIYKSYQLQSQNDNNFMNGLMGLGGAAISKWSDRRLKVDVKRVGTTPGLGLPLYEFAYLWDRARKVIGVMADEARGVVPAAVHRTASGYDAVDYGLIR